jgi:hypothetical protein
MGAGSVVAAGVEFVDGHLHLSFGARYPALAGGPGILPGSSSGIEKKTPGHLILSEAYVSLYIFFQIFFLWLPPKSSRIASLSWCVT